MSSNASCLKPALTAFQGGSSVCRSHGSGRLYGESLMQIQSLAPSSTSVWLTATFGSSAWISNPIMRLRTSTAQWKDTGRAMDGIPHESWPTNYIETARHYRFMVFIYYLLNSEIVIVKRCTPLGSKMHTPQALR